jgi:hypothetical protein
VSLQGLAVGSVVLLAAAVFCVSPDSGPIEAEEWESAVSVNALANSLISLSSDQLDRHISRQQDIIEMNQALLDELQIPAPIYATERSALPANRREIAARNADFNEYSAALATAKIKLDALLDARRRFDDK